MVFCQVPRAEFRLPAEPMALPTESLNTELAYTWKGRYCQPVATCLEESASTVLYCWLPKSGLVSPRNDEESSSAVVAGKRPPWLSTWAPCSLELSHSAKAMAASLFLLVTGTALDEPPFSAVTSAPADHCGTGETLHLPFVCGMLDSMGAGAQPPAIQQAYVPFAQACHQSLLQPGVGSTSFLASSPCQ